MKKKLINPLKIGKNLKRCVDQMGYKVKDIQEYLCLECPQPIYRWFKGSTYPSIHHLYALSCLLINWRRWKKRMGLSYLSNERGENDIRKSRNFVSVFLAYFLVFKYDIDTL